jgi:hypothetical protein
VENALPSGILTLLQLSKDSMWVGEKLDFFSMSLGSRGLKVEVNVYLESSRLLFLPFSKIFEFCISCHWYPSIM